jgi:osmotically-inducible protein OsmY
MPIAAVLALLLAAPTPSAPAAADEALRQRIEERLRKANLEGQASLAVSVEAGRVVLSGTATLLHAAREAERLAAKEAAAVETCIQVEPSQARGDAHIARDVREAVRSYVHYSVFDGVEASVEEGRVRLGGSVRHLYRRDDIEARVARVPGVREIENGIRVQPPSSHDEELRQQLYRAIYEGLLSGRGSVVDPPVHIVVDGGRVTLLGSVATAAERAALEAAARQAQPLEVEVRVQVEEAAAAAPRG